MWTPEAVIHRYTVGKIIYPQRNILCCWMYYYWMYEVNQSPLKGVPWLDADANLGLSSKYWSLC